MIRSSRVRLALVLASVWLTGCASRGDPRAGSSPAAPDQRAEYAALPDTTVCVVDRFSARGLRNLPAKRTGDGSAVLLVEGRIRPLDQVHAVGLIAGYAGAETWFRGDEPISLGGRRFVKVEGERRIALEQLHLFEEFRGVPLFVDPSDEPPPDAMYAPVRPGCIFQAYVREDLMDDR